MSDTRQELRDFNNQNIQSGLVPKIKGSKHNLMNSKLIESCAVKEILTTSIAPYIGINIGANIYNHTLKNKYFDVMAQTATGKEIALEVTAKTNTQLTITSLKAYPNAEIIIKG